MLIGMQGALDSIPEVLQARYVRTPQTPQNCTLMAMTWDFASLAGQAKEAKQRRSPQ